MTDKAAAAGPGGGELGPLPEWDLSHLYTGPEDERLVADLDGAETAARQFNQVHGGRLGELDGAALAAAITRYEAIDETLSRVISYAYLVYAGDVSNPENGRFLQACQERVTQISSHLLFFTLEINRMEQAALDERLAASPALARYGPWLRDIRVTAPHQLSDELERMLHEKVVVGRNAWVRLFDETIAQLRFPIEGESLTLSEALNRLTDHDGARRRAAADGISGVLDGQQRLFSLITNTLAKDKQIEDTWRRFQEPWSARNLANHVEDHVVDALLSAVSAAYPRLSHRYYALKARWFGGDTLAFWDRNAPLPDDADRTIAWGEAERIVLDAYGRFSPRLAEIGQRFFREGWIDAPVRPGKAPGAFAHATVPSAHPYILLNYHGKARDVMTLAHELGHGVHQVLAAGQGHLLSDTPLTLAETASVFGEMLTFRALLDAESDPRRRRALLAAKVEDMLNTVVRQIAFFEFERQVHAERREGELAAERIGEIWMSVQRASLGPALSFTDGYAAWWSYIPHFIHTPFYVYAYAFGDCLVNSLYALYLKAESGFAERYVEMLRAGGSKRHRELLAPFGLDAGDPGFWDKGLTVIADLIDELEALDRQVNPALYTGRPQ